MNGLKIYVALPKHNNKSDSGSKIPSKNPKPKKQISQLEHLQKPLLDSNESSNSQFLRVDTATKCKTFETINQTNLNPDYTSFEIETTNTAQIFTTIGDDRLTIDDKRMSFNTKNGEMI